MSTQETKLQTIANAIRAKEGSSALIQANDFAARILALQTVGGSSDLCRINLLSTDVNGGTVHGGGIASKNMSVNVSVTVNDGYYFEGWTENGEYVSTDDYMSFLVQRDRNLIANVFEIQYSLGVDWFSANMQTTSTWMTITYGGGKFVAVANNKSRAAYSTDGINWTDTTLPFSAPWYVVTYGGGKFVAVANGDKVVYSVDGINWESATLPYSLVWYAVAYGGGKFVATSGTAKAAYSTDGINWTATVMPSSASWQAVAYGDRKFVAISYNGNFVAYSQGNSASS